MDEQSLQSPQTVEIPPEKSTLLPILIGLLLLTLVGIGGYFFVKNQTNQSIVVIPTVIPSIPSVPTQVVLDEATNWKTYTNTKYGYSLKYPSDYNIESCHYCTDLPKMEMISIFYALATNNSQGYGFISINIIYPSLEDIRKLNKITIGNNLEAYTETKKSFEYESKYIYFLNGSNVISISYSGIGSSSNINVPLSSLKDYAIFNQILSTLRFDSLTPSKFLDQNQVSDNCVRDSDCILINKDSNYGCNFSGECQPVDYSLDKWMSVNAGSQQEYIKNKCPDILKMGRPNCFPKPINDQYTSKCISNRCQKVPI